MIVVLLIVLVKLILERKEIRDRYWAILLLLLISSCGSKREVVENNTEKSESETVRTSSVNELTQKGEVIYKTKPVYSQIIIAQPCDEEGNFQPINQTIGSGENKVTIKTVNGQLIIDQYIDSTITSIKKELREKFISDSLKLRKQLYRVEVREVEVIRTVWPWWVWTVIVGGILFAALWVYQKFFIPIKL